MRTFAVPSSPGATTRAAIIRNVFAGAVTVEIAPPDTAVFADLRDGRFCGASLPLAEARVAARTHDLCCQVVAREEHRDVLLVDGDSTPTLAGLEVGARVAVLGSRRLSLLRAFRPDVEGIQLDADLDGAVARVVAGDVTAVIAEGSTVVEAGHEDRVGEWLEPTAWVPEAASGALAILLPRDAGPLLVSPQVAAAVEAEEAVVAGLAGTAVGVVGAMAIPYGPHLRLWGLTVSQSGKRAVRVDLTGDVKSARELGLRVASSLVARGAGLTAETDVEGR